MITSRILVSNLAATQACLAELVNTFIIQLMNEGTSRFPCLTFI
jgi:hypothetical protein